MMVSFLVPVYNSAPFLKECVQSLTGQTYTDLQIVLINDGSTDGSWDILLELARQDKRIEVYSKANGGVAETRNLLLKKARGEWVLFIDSDDWIEPDTVESLMNEQAVGNYDIVSYKLSGQTGDGTVVYTRQQAVKLFLEHISFRGSLCDKLIRQSLFDGLSFDATVSYGEDAMMVWQVLQRAEKVCVLDKGFYHYRINPDSISHQSFNGKKFSAYTVWDFIKDDVEKLWPEYKEIARARFACEMTQVLYAAARSRYPHNMSVQLLQEVIRKNGRFIKKTGISSLKMSLYSWLVSHNYYIARFLSRYV